MCPAWCDYRLRELAPQQGNLVVIVDRQSAHYPWELLENRWSNGERPPSVAAGFVRQCRTETFRQRPLHSPGNTALVIGNPDLQGSADFADLPGARDEAQAVADQLSGEGYDVIDCIDQAATPIMEALHKNSWRILHLAGHGVHEHPAATGKVSGMVIGPASFLTPGDIAQMRYVPELVFINCCHLGRVYSQFNDWRGVRYQYGGVSRLGIDCSGFVYVTFKTKLGIDLPRTPAMQVKLGEEISQSELRPGDLICL